MIPCAGKSYWGWRLSTVDLLVLTSLDQLVFILKILFSFFYKTSYLNEEVNWMTLDLMTLSITIRSIMTLRITTLSIVIPIMTTLSVWQSGWPDWAKFHHLGNFLWLWANFYLEKIAQWFGQNFSQPWKNCLKLTLIRLKFCSKRGFLHVYQKYSKKFISFFYVKKNYKRMSSAIGY